MHVTYPPSRVGHRLATICIPHCWVLPTTASLYQPQLKKYPLPPFRLGHHNLYHNRNMDHGWCQNLDRTITSLSFPIRMVISGSWEKGHMTPVSVSVPRTMQIANWQLWNCKVQIILILKTPWTGWILGGYNCRHDTPRLHETLLGPTGCTRWILSGLNKSMAADAVIWHNQCLVQTPVSTWDTSVFQETSVYWETGVFLGHWCLSGSPAQKEVSGRQCQVSVGCC